MQQYRTSTVSINIHETRNTIHRLVLAMELDEATKEFMQKVEKLGFKVSQSSHTQLIDEDQLL